MSNAYERAGVNIAAGDEVVQNLKKKMSQQDGHVIGQLGGFAGMYEMDDSQLDTPVLVAGSDGVGTKVLLASAADKVDMIGQDLIAMCVNDLLAQGALPLFFLDYMALAEVKPEQIDVILNRILTVCQDNGIVLLGGETAEMPGVYQPGHFDLAGFAVGLASKRQLLNPANVQAGDILLGLPASGLHSNGFSLVRKILFEDNEFEFSDHVDGINGELIDELLTPTKLYVNLMQPLLQQRLIAGAAHITGGGLLENVPRMLPADLQAEIDTSTWKHQPIFDLLVNKGELSVEDRYETFNMGLGMVLAIHTNQLAEVTSLLGDEEYYQIGQVSKLVGEQQVKLLGENDD
ncbi:phosphoribosylformylglycinamidine cyclo-ligase [Paucilactobacillus oligofermentans DSM 15707 = LMG 22743]|uniref:Phosphoribosylformylglycinamidine cyclo-ligase n=1 Tax=Paucilactobacillus oligofermentans DSM 15707 = LMG 22743 TaxID=1423778 RepID=A0A0R1RGA2_9LACO|nr:phosphoribosylformylglycinamidine cyclo-ligase [Paucilactobacillus oligofermentans]KRL55401.1 phosphoribosylformylglycinamidine cyclo-ligase [Paucilactobacillus oligofermentans DSM 15707 = LMG 22743]CUS25609.1 Phosphoribosylformylglycinamidine cyclo-ligase PurM [Paucilactobacillus oligofermentans DSM 15707 = LMG 22743]